MASTFESREIEPVPITAGCVKPGNIIVFETADRKEFIKVTDITKVKTGKHGAAKVILNGKELKTGATKTNNFNAGQTLLIATMKKKQYILVDVLEESESFYMRINDNSGTPPEEYAFNLMSEEEKNRILSEYEKNDRSQLIVHVTTSAGFFMIDDIRVFREDA